MSSRLRKARAHSLSIERFASLPYSVVAEICRFLNPRDVVALVRSSSSMRKLFMSRMSKPCWDAARTLQRIPDWAGVASPQAAVFLFYDECQGKGCNGKANFEAFFVCRRYCSDCARSSLVSAKEAVEAFPNLPKSLVLHLPWTKQRPKHDNTGFENGRYYLKEDVTRLWKLVQIRPWQTTALREELLSRQQAMLSASQQVRLWYRQERMTSRQRYSERWPRIRSVLQKRLGWEPVPYQKVSPFLKPLVNYLLDVPALTDAVWNELWGDLLVVIRDDAKQRDTASRPFSLASKAVINP